MMALSGNNKSKKIMKKIAILGFGKVGKTLWKKIQNEALWQEQFQVKYLWNRSYEVFEKEHIPDSTIICKRVEDVLHNIADIDLVVECAHADVIKQYGALFLEQTDLLVFSPTVFSDAAFRQSIQAILQEKKQTCYLPLGASIAIWDIIRLEQNRQLKHLKITMTKPPQSFRIKDKVANVRLQLATILGKRTEIATDSIAKINAMAPQNTNTMAIYALAAPSLDSSRCVGAIYADSNIEAHIVQCEVETTIGLTYHFERYNPAKVDAVTGSATFASFLNSVLRHDSGIRHNHFVFC